MLIRGAGSARALSLLIYGFHLSGCQPILGWILGPAIS